MVWKGQRFTHGLPQLSSGSGRSGISRLGVVVVVFLGDAFDRDGRAVLADFDFLRPALAEVDEVLAGALVLLGASSVVETVFVGVVDEAVRTLGASDSVVVVIFNKDKVFWKNIFVTHIGFSGRKRTPLRGTQQN